MVFEMPNTGINDEVFINAIYFHAGHVSCDGYHYAVTYLSIEREVFRLYLNMLKLRAAFHFQIGRSKRHTQGLRLSRKSDHVAIIVRQNYSWLGA